MSETQGSKACGRQKTGVISSALAPTPIWKLQVYAGQVGQSRATNAFTTSTCFLEVL